MNTKLIVMLLIVSLLAAYVPGFGGYITLQTTDILFVLVFDKSYQPRTLLGGILRSMNVSGGQKFDTSQLAYRSLSDSLDSTRDRVLKESENITLLHELYSVLLNPNP